MQPFQEKTVNESMTESRLEKTGRKGDGPSKKIRKVAIKKNAANFLLATYHMIEVYL